MSFTNDPKYGYTLLLMSLRRSIAHCEEERFGEIRLNPSGTHTAFSEGEFGSTGLFCHGFFASKAVKNNKLEEVEPRGGGGRVRHSAAMGYFFARGH